MHFALTAIGALRRLSCVAQVAKRSYGDEASTAELQTAERESDLSEAVDFEAIVASWMQRVSV